MQFLAYNVVNGFTVDNNSNVFYGVCLQER